MSRSKTRVVAWLDPAKPLQREVIASIEGKLPKERHQYILSLLLRGYEFSGNFIYRETLRALKDYQPQFDTKKHEEVDDIPENMLDFLFSLQEEGESGLGIP